MPKDILTVEKPDGSTEKHKNCKVKHRDGRIEVRKGEYGERVVKTYNKDNLVSWRKNRY